MAGALPLTDEEFETVLNNLKNTRDKCLFALGINTGYRITELLSIKLSDVYKDGIILNRLKIARRNIKAHLQSRDIPLNRYSQYAIQTYVQECGPFSPDDYLFQSRKGENRAISRIQAHNILHDAFTKSNLYTSYSTHTMRKTFAHFIYKSSGNDLIATQMSLGHADITTTIKYLNLKQQIIDDLILNK